MTRPSAKRTITDCAAQGHHAPTIYYKDPDNCNLSIRDMKEQEVFFVIPLMTANGTFIITDPTSHRQPVAPFAASLRPPTTAPTSWARSSPIAFFMGRV